jgi:hypothetical protein
VDAPTEAPSLQPRGEPVDTGDAGDARDARRGRRSDRAGSGFVLWGAGTYLLAVGTIAALSLRRTGGRWVYALDDAGIHLSVAKSLADHGTWGVVPGHFESASSSPLWTVLLAGWIKVAPGAMNVAPFVLNVIAALAVIALIGTNQRALRPSLRRPLDVLAVAALVVVVLYLPALTMIGMEHTLHIALILASVILFHRQFVGERDRGPGWLPYVLLAVATLVRFESAFVAAGLAAALLWLPTGPTDGLRLRRRLRPAVLVGLAAALPLAGFSLFNHLMGQGLLPNSVLAKTRSTGDGAGRDAFDAFGRLTVDPVLAVLTAAVLVLLVLGWSQLVRSRFLAIVVLVTVGLHVVFARVGWFERYQAYLVALGVYLVLEVLAEGLAVPGLGVSRTRATCGVVAVLLLFSGTKAAKTLRTPEGVEDTYGQRYQAAVFLERYYAGQPVATGELGYISLLHEGPITDIFGLGDYEVLVARRAADGIPDHRYWDDLTQRRGFRVAAVYPTSLFMEVPESWILVGEWTMDRQPLTAIADTFQFWATTSDEVAPLEAHLREFESDLPGGVDLDINANAGLQAMHHDALASDDG